MRPGSSHTGKRRKNRARGAAAPPELALEVRKECEARIGYKFKDASLLDRAMTHRSAVSGSPSEWSNERLEFLGDRVLGLVVAGAMLERFPTEPEGQLAPRLNAVVSRETCAIVGRDLGLDEVLIVDRAERAAGGASKPSLLSNAAEAMLGAVYLDGGLKAASKVVLAHWKTALAGTKELQRDPKSMLQEWAQGAGLPTPAYELVERSGPDHAPEFTVKAVLQDAAPTTGKGRSKQDAERAAAAAMLEQVGHD